MKKVIKLIFLLFCLLVNKKMLIVETFKNTHSCIILSQVLVDLMLVKTVLTNEIINPPVSFDSAFMSLVTVESTQLLTESAICSVQPSINTNMKHAQTT